MNRKIVCFDVDGTLTEVKSSWEELTRGLALPADEISEIYYRTEDGSMSFAEGEKRLKDIFLTCENANREYITGLFEKMPLRKDAPGLINYLKSNDYLVYLVSGTIDMYVEMIAKQLNPDGFMSCWSFDFDKQNALSDIGYLGGVNQKHMKANYLRGLSKDHGIPVNEIFYAGDSSNDLEAFKMTGKGIAVEPFSEVLRPAAWRTVEDLDKIREIL
ncbi:MAG: HAD-IB family phosphatase [Candidatus Pacebacteria bacterium]|jgi:phosphoserine phosphatase|nr:HAD-IB family phosphatase [Candidatus Paceibacterota bacterium]